MNKRRYLAIAGIVVVIVLISILLHTMLANHQPVITSLATDPEGVLPLGKCQIVCNATGRNGDNLSYNWSAIAGTISGTGAAVNWTAPSAAGFYNVTVRVTDGRGGLATDYVTIPVRSDTAPTITKLIANAAWTTPSGNLQVTCNASDPDGDKLSYEWTTDGGTISGRGAAVNWTAPQKAGTYNITAVVKDGYGGKARRFVTLAVAHDTPPTIENLIVTPKGHIYLRKSTAGGDYDVWIVQKYDIECVASSTSSELFYEWSCDGGEISGEGSTITWTAPNERSVTVAVTATVSDAAGNSVAKNIVFTVASCTCGSWGLS